jgi:hypothetical protein
VVLFACLAIGAISPLARATDLVFPQAADDLVFPQAADDLVFPQAADDRDAVFESSPATADDGASVIVRVSAKSDACADATEECRDALKTLRDDDIAGISLDIRVGGKPGNDYPCECRLEGETYEPRRFATTMFTWKAAGYCHKPLYFEDWNLERYGHSHGWADPIISGAHFFATLPVLPYKMGVELPWECVYPLGYYRPGNCAPWTCPAIPISGRGLALEAATVTGLVFLLP